MSEAVEPPVVTVPPKEDPQRLILRGKPRPVARFRRGVIIAGTGGVAAALIALSWFALDPPSFKKSGRAVEAEEPVHNGAADALANAPQSYGDVPRLGPPLPGDLGRPILEHQIGLGRDPSQRVDAESAEAARSAAEARRQRLDAARSSPVLVELARSETARDLPMQTNSAPVGTLDPAAPAEAVSSQQHKAEFARSSEGDSNPYELHVARSPWTLAAGTIIPASLITGLNSDLPGTVIAQVTENVRDTATGQIILIPQGARLIGIYDATISYGQRRALVVWTRILLPDGSSVGLDKMPATDSSGYSGLADSVNSHTWTLLKGVALATLLGVGTQLSLGSSESDLLRAVRESTQQNAAHAGDEITMRNLEVQPTITVRPGWPVRVVVTKGIVLQPWKG